MKKIDYKKLNKLFVKVTSSKDIDEINHYVTRFYTTHEKEIIKCNSFIDFEKRFKDKNFDELSLLLEEYLPKKVELNNSELLFYIFEYYPEQTLGLLGIKNWWIQDITHFVCRTSFDEKTFTHFLEQIGNTKFHREIVNKAIHLRRQNKIFAFSYLKYCDANYEELISKHLFTEYKGFSAVEISPYFSQRYARDLLEKSYKHLKKMVNQNNISCSSSFFTNRTLFVIKPFKNKQAFRKELQILYQSNSLPRKHRKRAKNPLNKFRTYKLYNEGYSPGEINSKIFLDADTNKTIHEFLKTQTDHA